MTTRTIRFVILAVRVTIGAIPLTMIFIKYQTCDTMSEVLLVPTAMAGIAVVIQFGDLFSGRMT